MLPGKPSRTAWGAAFHRAAHQVLEQGRIFSDPLALPILGIDASKVDPEVEMEAGRRGIRMFIAARTRFTEDALAAAVERGTAQLVVLGAGLDTYAYRGACRDRLQIFEVDHPTTQHWKRVRLDIIGMPRPTNLTFAPIDFECETLNNGLAKAGFNRVLPAFFAWLGVVPYLTKDAVWSTLTYIGDLPKSAEVVFDYTDPPETLTPELRQRFQERAARVAQLGEAWRCSFTPVEMHTKLASLGFRAVEDLGPRQIAERFFPTRAATAPETGGHILRAAKY